MQNKLLVTLLAGVLTVSSMAVMAGDGGKHRHGDMRGDMRAFNEAVMSGALTDAELVQLKTAREVARAQMQKTHAELKATTDALINNADRGPKRDSWPKDLLREPRSHQKMSENDAFWANENPRGA